MASPQVKNGYTRIANEILENIIKTHLNGTQYRLVMIIWRYTYGFKRTSHELSVSYIAKKINASRSQVDRELSSLIDKKIIVSDGIGKKGARVLSFNKNYEEWKTSSEKRIGSLVEEQPKGKKSKKASAKKYDEDNTYYKMAVFFLEKLSTMVKEMGIKKSFDNTNLQSWADDFRKLVEIDKVTDKKQIFDVMNWVIKDPFWKTNVLSAKTFRKQYLTLSLRMVETNSRKQPSQSTPKDIRDKEIEFSKYLASGGDPDAFDWSK